jgi:large conductance mechanosensitive channel
MFKEFKEFALKGPVFDLAVGVIIGAAFSKIVDSLVKDIIMPIVGMFGSADFSNYFLPLSKAVTATNLVDAQKQGPVLAWGSFVTYSVNFLIIAFILFLLVRGMNSMKRSLANEAPAPAKPAAPSASEVLLTEIRDLLAKKPA